MSPVTFKLADLDSALELLAHALENAGAMEDPLVNITFQAALLHLEDAVRLENERVCALHEQAKKDLFTIQNLN